jgi:hypothetical protein
MSEVMLNSSREFQATAALTVKTSLFWELGWHRATVSDPPSNYLELTELFTVLEDDFIIPTNDTVRGNFLNSIVAGSFVMERMLVVTPCVSKDLQCLLICERPFCFYLYLSLPKRGKHSCVNT